MHKSVARGTGGRRLIRLGTGGLLAVEVEARGVVGVEGTVETKGAMEAGGAVETGRAVEAEAEGVCFSVSSSEITMLSWKSAKISGTPVVGAADDTTLVLDV